MIVNFLLLHQHWKKNIDNLILQVMVVYIIHGAGTDAFVGHRLATKVYYRQIVSYTHVHACTYTCTCIPEGCG